MTANQLAFQRNKEQERSNKMNETLTEHRNVSSRMSATADKVKSDVAKFQAQLQAAKTEADISKINAEIHRYEVQNGVDIANAVTGGIRNIGTGLGSAIKGIVTLGA